MEKDTFKTFKHLRITNHSHNPVDEVTANDEALLISKKKSF